MANLLSILSLIIPLFAISASASVFVSIDCGSSDLTYTDDNSIEWQGDDSLIGNGQSRVVQNADPVSQVMSTLRVFTTRKKNCYLVQVDKDGMLLVRASFYYGNYDNKSSPPTFGLQYDGNEWTTVVTSSDQVVSHEVIYVPKGDIISVCVAQTMPNQLPFVSALEVRSLDADMYSLVDSATFPLYLSKRVAFGANATVRYSDDAYDRIWIPAIASNGLTTVTSDALLISTSIKDSPPASVLQNAVTPTLSSQSIILSDSTLNENTPIYINTYFSEVSQLGSTQNRSFALYMNNVRISSTIVPPYASVVEHINTNLTANANTTFSLIPATDSTLPPIINALELFRVGDALTDGTNSNDALALEVLQQQFDKLQEWVGDPCLPAKFNWEWVACSSDATPRITAVYLNGLQLEGPIPDFSAMDALQTIEMQNNSLNGEIPDFLGTLPNLKQLNLADNDFSGSIPSTISKNNKIKLDVSGNPNLCVSGKSCKSSSTDASSGTGNSIGKRSSKLPVILGSTIPTFIILWVIVGVAALIHKRRKAAAIAAVSAGQNGGPGKPNGPPQVMPVAPQANGVGRSHTQQSTTEDIKVEIHQQMEAEFADLVEQQAQGNESGKRE